MSHGPEGGRTYSAAAHVIPSWKFSEDPDGDNAADTSRIPGSGTNVTCSAGSCWFQTRFSVGDVLIAPADGSSGVPYLITGISSESAMTVSVATTFGSNAKWQVGKRWASGDMGYSYHQHHDKITVLGRRFEPIASRAQSRSARDSGV